MNVIDAKVLSAVLAGWIIGGCGGEADFQGSDQANSADVGGIKPDGDDAGGGDSAGDDGGDDGGDGGPDNDVDDTSDGGQGDGGDDGAAAQSLTWDWPCQHSPTSAPKPSSLTDIVISGSGPHEFKRKDLEGAPITFTGELCQPAAVPRDIVLVIDTSGSMDHNDTMRGGSCGRLAALRKVMTSIPAGVGNFSIVTFNSDEDSSSTGLFASEAELFADIAPNGDIGGVVCGAEGDTNYDAGLQRAGALLSMGRADATKEIYFISDGEPTHQRHGIQVASALKTKGVSINGKKIRVTIATVMLRGVDSVLRDFIASRDARGRPLHAFVGNTSLLTQALNDLTSNIIAGVELKYRPIGSTQWTRLDVSQYLQGFNFKLPSVSIDMERDTPNGLEVLFEYWDSRDNRYSSEGQLVWAADNSSDDS